MEKIEYRYRFWYRPKFMVSVSVSTKKASIAHHYGEARKTNPQKFILSGFSVCWKL